MAAIARSEVIVTSLPVQTSSDLRHSAPKAQKETAPLFWTQSLPISLVDRVRPISLGKLTDQCKPRGCNSLLLHSLPQLPVPHPILRERTGPLLSSWQETSSCHISSDHSAPFRRVAAAISRAEAPTFRLGLRVRMRWKGANQTTHPALQFSSIQLRCGHVSLS